MNWHGRISVRTLMFFVVSLAHFFKGLTMGLLPVFIDTNFKCTNIFQKWTCRS